MRHLPRVMSDHCPILIQLYSNHNHVVNRKPFRFEAMWLKHKDFGELVCGNWGTQAVSITDRIQKIIDVLSSWNREKFGNIFHNKRKLLARI